MKLIFCYNKISFLIAKKMQKEDCINIIIYSADRIRCDEKKVNFKCKVFEIYLPYCKIVGVFFAFISRIAQVEVIVPHDNAGRLIKKIVSNASIVGIIDDGLDTFRDKPRSEILTRMKLGTNYYTFNYKLKKANWTGSYNVIEVAELIQLAGGASAKYFDGVNIIIIESPGIENYLKSCNIYFNNHTVFIKHPSSIKNNSLNRFRNVKIYEGTESLESILINFKGDIVIGYTFSLIFLLEVCKASKKIHLFMNRSDYENITSLHSELNDLDCTLI